MDTTQDQDAVQEQTPECRRHKPRLSQWLWRPWYARTWWASATAYWTGFALSFPVSVFRAFYESTLAGYLNVAFYPPIILMVLGTGFVQAKIRRGDWVFVAGEPQPYKPNRSDGGALDPYSDPLDPRSGSLYVGSPQNRARLFGRKWP